MSEKSPNLTLNLYTNEDSPKKFGVWLEEMAGTSEDSNMMKIDAAFSAIGEDLTRKADLVDGKIPAGQLPAFVDDVLEFSKKSAFPAQGETGKIYVDAATNLTYRWSGTSYVEISPSLALGETASTAYRGDRGKTAYTHSQTSGNPHGTTAAQVGARPDTWMPTPEEVGADPEGSAAAVQDVLDAQAPAPVPAPAVLDVMAAEAVEVAARENAALLARIAVLTAIKSIKPTIR